MIIDISILQNVYFYMLNNVDDFNNKILGSLKSYNSNFNLKV